MTKTTTEIDFGLSIDDMNSSIDHSKHLEWSRFRNVLIIQICQSIWTSIDWSLFFMTLSYSYWHMLNVYNLGFNIQALLAFVFSFLLTPSLFFIPTIDNFFTSTHGLFVSRLLTLILLVCGIQIQESVRTVFTAFATSFIFLRMFSCAKVEYNFWPQLHSLHYSFGLFFLLSVRSLFLSLHPLDNITSTSLPILVLAAGLISAFIIFDRTLHNSANHQGKWDKFLCVPTLHQTTRLSKILIGFFGSCCLAGTLFLTSYLMSSDAVIPRWSNLDPTIYGSFVIIFFGFGCIIQTVLIFYSDKMRPIVDWSVRWLILVIFVVGFSLFLSARSQLEQSFSLSGDVTYSSFFLENTLPFVYTGGLLIATTLPSIFDTGLSMVWFYFNTTQRHLPKVGMMIVICCCLVSGFISHLCWYVGPMIPLVGNIFWSNESRVLSFSLVSVALAFLIGLYYRLKFRHLNDKLDESINGKLEESLKYNPRNIEVNCAFITYRNVYFYSSLSTICLTFFLFFLPAVRIHSALRSERGSRSTKPKTFTVGSYNIQMGLTFYDQNNLGFPVGNRLKDVDPFVDIWGLQETDSVNLLQMNRDWVSYLADQNHYHPYFGAPSFLSTPGVSFLSTEKMSDIRVHILPRGGEPLNRVLLVGNYPYRSSPNAPILAHITIASTHISAFDAESRRMQLEAIREILQLHIRSNKPLILMGDFNEGPELVEPILTRETDLIRVPFPSTIPTETGHNGHLDQIYYQNLDLQSLNIPRTFGLSDHLPVIAAFKLKSRDN